MKTKQDILNGLMPYLGDLRDSVKSAEKRYKTIPANIRADLDANARATAMYSLIMAECLKRLEGDTSVWLRDLGGHKYIQIANYALHPKKFDNAGHATFNQTLLGKSAQNGKLQAECFDFAIEDNSTQYCICLGYKWIDGGIGDNIFVAMPNGLNSNLWIARISDYIDPPSLPVSSTSEPDDPKVGGGFRTHSSGTA